jgi:hypothetical protein
VKRYLHNNRITWNFIVERAPWWGGFWESLVRSVTRPLKKILGRSTLSFEELRTILVNIVSFDAFKPDMVDVLAQRQTAPNTKSSVPIDL